MNAARKWLEIAFAPHPEEYERSRIQSIQPDDPDSLLIFVRFYHHLDLDDVIAATKYLRSERKKRGHNFDGPGVRNDDENNASSIHVGNGRPKKTKRSKGGATELPSGGVLSLPPPETPRSEETSLEVPSHLENVEGTRLEISSQYPSHSKPDGSTPQAPEMDDGEEIQTLQSENKRKKKIRSTPHLVVDTSHQCIPHPPPNHVPQSPTSSPLTDLSESTPSPSFTPDLVPKSRMRSGKKSRPLHPPSRTLPSRAASNPDRLSEMIRSENKHYNRLRSGRDPTPETNAGGLTSPVGRVVSSSKNRSSRKRRKKASVRKGDVSDNMDRGVPEHTISHIESATQDDEPANQEMASQGAAAPGPSFPPEPKHQCDARKNASKKKRQRRQKNFSPDGRICLPPPSNKRQRKNDSSFSAVDTSTGQELAQQPNSPLVVPVDSTGELVASQLQKDPEVCITSSRILGSQDMKANQLLSNSVQPMRSSSSRKRSRDETEVYVVESLVHQGPMGEEIPRGSKPLPKRNHHSTMPLPPRPDLGTVHPGDPMRLVDVDRYICDIAAAESVLLTDTGVRHDDWVEAISDSTINSREGDDEGGVGKAPMVTDGPLSTLASTEGDTGYSSNPAVITSSRPQMPIISSPEQVHLPKRALAQFPPIWAQVCDEYVRIP